MVHELLLFGILAGVTAVAGLLIRLFSHEESRKMTLETWDVGRDLFVASAAVIPTTLIVKSRQIGSQQVLAIVVVILAIVLWGKGESRYFSLWRREQKRPVEPDGNLGKPVQAFGKGAKRRKVLAFVLGNGLGLLVLFAATALSETIGS